MNRYVKYGVFTVAAITIVILSVDIRKLDVHNAIESPGNFNASAYAIDIWENRLPIAINSGPDFISLLKILEVDPVNAFENYGRKLGISKTYYFMAKGEGLIISVNEENLVIVVEGGIQIHLAIDFIFGNVVRDGSGIVDIDDFETMTDFNNLAIELNSIVKEEIVPQLKELAQPGMKVYFAGAFELNENEVDVRNIRVTPVSVELSDGE